MLKSIWGHFREGVTPFLEKKYFYHLVVFSGLLFLQILLRFYDLDFHGIWRDEVATLFYSSHLSKVFSGESHTLFYYALIAPISSIDPLNLFNIRLFHSVLSFLLFVLILMRSRKIFSMEQWFFFNSLYGLHPAVFGFSRLARPYGLIIDLTVLLIIECRHALSKRLIFFISMALGLIYPIALFPLVVEFLVTRNKKDFFKIFAFSSLPILLYYGLKFYFDKQSLSYISWINRDSFNFISELNNLMAGSYFPFYQSLSYPSGNWIISLLVVVMAISVVYYKSLEGKKNLVVFLGTYGGVIALTAIMSSYINLRINRYFIFLIPYFLMALTFAVPVRKYFSLALTSVLSVVILLQVVHVEPYFARRHSFGSLISAIDSHVQINGGLRVLACGYVFHNWYFKQLNYDICSDDKIVRKYEAKSEKFLYVYMDKPLAAPLLFMKNKKVLDYENLADGNILLVGDIK